MTKAEIEERWQAIDRELIELWAGRVCCDPPAREAELLIEQDALEFELGQIQFSERDATR
jgi:hypothetical protein